MGIEPSPALLDVLLLSGLSTLLEKDYVFPFGAIGLSHIRRTVRDVQQIGKYAFGTLPVQPSPEAVIENHIRGLTQSGLFWPLTLSEFRDDYLARSRFLSGSADRLKNVLNGTI
jgi:hypothetical protein